ncbi:2'-5' RNA ligase family protein [Fictibacillus sp. Mic-4]|uniref:2'-5' RNA ligase family protein n=1 Tax=Fictibacillus TaxID=1329200 RepID=UPI0003F7CB7C|nr:2'-5' RNA ligase family protein [Fictibacillus gelatini]
MRYGIVIFPSKELQEKVNSYRKRYDPHYAWIAAHITLKESFDASDSEIDNIVDYIERITKNVPPFEITIEKVGSFHPVNNVIYLKVNDGHDLRALHDAFYSGPLENEERYNFVPHLTLAQKLSDIEHADVLERLKMLDIRHQEVVESIHLLRKSEKGNWLPYREFKLGGK